MPQDLFDLTGKVAVVTGGAGLLGRRFAEALLAAGAIVETIDGRPTRAKMSNWVIDITDRDKLGLVLDRIAGPDCLDILVNAAAINPQPADVQMPFEDYPLDAWQKSLDVNLTGTMLCCQAAGRIMRKQGHGVIVNIASTYGMVAPDQRIYGKGNFKPADYCVGKAGVIQLTRYLAAYWGGTGIRVNCLSPGGVANGQDAEFVKNYADCVPMGRMAEPDELCGALLFLCSDASSYMTGANLVVDGGWTAW